MLIAAAVAGDLAFTVWAVARWRAAGAPRMLAIAVAGGVLAVGLLAYLRWFWGKGGLGRMRNPPE